MRIILFKLMKKFFATLCLLAVASSCVFGKQDLAKIQARSMGLLQPQQVLIQKKEDTEEIDAKLSEKSVKIAKDKEEHPEKDQSAQNLLIHNRAQQKQSTLLVATPKKPDPSVTAPNKLEPTEAALSKSEPSEAVPSKPEPSQTTSSKSEPSQTTSRKSESSQTISSKSEPSASVSGNSEPSLDISRHEPTPTISQHVKSPSVPQEKDTSRSSSLQQQSATTVSTPTTDPISPKKAQSQAIHHVSSNDNTLVLSFDYAPRENRALSDSHVKVLWNGVVVYSVIPKDFAIHTASVEVTSKSGPNVLQFEGSENSNGYGLTIDNVKLVKKGTTKDLVINGGFENPNLKGGWKQMTKIEGWQGTPLQIGAGKIYNSRWTSQIAELDSTQNYKLTQHFTFP